MSWRMFLDEISIWIGVVDCPSQHGWASSSLLRSWIKQKVEEGGIYHVFFGGGSASLLSWDISFHLLLPMDWGLHNQPCWFSDLRAQTRLQHWPPCILSLQMAAHGTPQPPGSCEPVPSKQSPQIYVYASMSVSIPLYLSYWFCFFREPWLIQWCCIWRVLLRFSLSWF